MNRQKAFLRSLEASAKLVLLKRSLLIRALEMPGLLIDRKATQKYIDHLTAYARANQKMQLVCREAFAPDSAAVAEIAINQKFNKN
jgi:hypothetical protein